MRGFTETLVILVSHKKIRKNVVKTIKRTFVKRYIKNTFFGKTQILWVLKTFQTIEILKYSQYMSTKLFIT